MVICRLILIPRGSCKPIYDLVTDLVCLLIESSSETPPPIKLSGNFGHRLLRSLSRAFLLLLLQYAYLYPMKHYAAYGVDRAISAA